MDEIVLQQEEVSEVAYFSQKEIVRRIDNDYDGITKKKITWPFIKRIIEKNIINELQQKN